MKLNELNQYYDAASRWYDLFTKLVFEKILRLGYLRKDSLDFLEPLRGARVLEVGCGTGLNFEAIEERIGPEGRLVAMDYSPGMLSKAQEKLERRGWGNVLLVQDDAVEQEKVQGEFDAVVCFWCLGIVYDLQAALESSLSHLKPGGGLVIVDFQRARPQTGWLRWLYPVYRRLLIWAKIDTPEDLDDERLRSKWDRALEFLEGRLERFHRESYLYGTGLIVYGRKT